MECPVCCAPARTVRLPAFEGKSIKCPNCRDYDVSKAVLERGLLQKLDRAQRRDVLERARTGAAPNTRPVITSYIL
jgi:hypothetical protein